MFLDSHCEVGTDWLQPLLQRIKLNRKTVASPVIDNINLATFDLQPVSTFLRGGFDWRLDFFWEWLPASDRARKLRDPTSSVASPAIAGGLFAVARDWFEELGWYDEGMEVWGGENIEISLRVWMCGGSLEIVPCSKVVKLDLKEKSNLINSYKIWRIQFKMFRKSLFFSIFNAPLLINSDDDSK